MSFESAMKVPERTGAGVVRVLVVVGLLALLGCGPKQVDWIEGDRVVGKIQIEQLLSERSLQLGDDFELGAFHDDLLSRGMIPLTLIRWEMTGQDDEVRAIWREAAGAELRAGSP